MWNSIRLPLCGFTKLPKANPTTKKSGSGQITRNGQSGLFGGSRTNRAEIFYIEVLVNPATGGISFHTIAGNELLKDKDYGTSFADKNDAGTPSYQVRGSFLLDKNEPIYGVGQVMDGKFNRRNSMHHMQNENMFTYSPYFMSPVKAMPYIGTTTPFQNSWILRRNSLSRAWDTVRTIISCMAETPTASSPRCAT